uniref:Uncharacterized protein n=1 Tax=Glossina brevipalpis TaxID=37001 RepID=A0A1A9WBZ5_9MUSC
MLLIKFIIVSLLYHICCSSAIDGAQSNIQDNKKETKSTMKQSNIYNIKRLSTATRKTIIERNKQKAQKYHEQKHQTELKSNDHSFEGVTKTTTTSASATATATAMAKATATSSSSLNQSINLKKYKNLTKNSHKLNKKMLSKLGFTKVKAPNSHNRKRLAIESRHHASPDDSHMFIIKLPPNMHYYSHPKAYAAAAASATTDSKNSLTPKTLKHAEDANGKKVNKFLASITYISLCKEEKQKKNKKTKKQKKQHNNSAFLDINAFLNITQDDGCMILAKKKKKKSKKKRNDCLLKSHK